MRPVKTEKAAARDAESAKLADRVGVLLRVLSPWDSKPLTYGEFASVVGRPVTEGAVTKWAQGRTGIPPASASAIVAAAERKGIGGVTLDWLYRSVGPGPNPGAAREEERCLQVLVDQLAARQEHTDVELQALREAVAQLQERLLSPMPQAGGQ